MAGFLREIRLCDSLCSIGYRNRNPSGVPRQTKEILLGWRRKLESNDFAGILHSSALFFNRTRTEKRQTITQPRTRSIRSRQLLPSIKRRAYKPRCHFACTYAKQPQHRLSQQQLHRLDRHFNGDDWPRYQILGS